MPPGVSAEDTAGQTSQWHPRGVKFVDINSVGRPDRCPQSLVDRIPHPSATAIKLRQMIMKPCTQASACTTSNDVLCTTSPSDASRIVAWVSAAGAVVWGGLLVGFVGSGSNVGSSGFLVSVLLATVLHIGQAFASAVSFKLGALFAVAAFAVAAAVLIENREFQAMLTTPLICSACALVIARRHAASTCQENVG